MLATPGTLPIGPGWIYEVEWDGMRVLADVVDGALTLHGRDGEVTAQLPELAVLPALAPDVLLDGEVVLLDNGVPSPDALAERLHRPVDARAARARPVTFMAFDVLRLYGVPLLDRSQRERRATLERLDLAAVAPLALSPTYTDGPALLAVTEEHGMAGVVAKRGAAPYRPGGRSPDWIRVSHRRTQPCLVGGWRAAGPSPVGSLLLGVLDRHGLSYAGRVGVVDDDVRRSLGERLAAVAAPSPPFTARPDPGDAAGARWCEPAVVVEVDHLGWTGTGLLRSPVLRGVRDDLHPADAVRAR